MFRFRVATSIQKKRIFGFRVATLIQGIKKAIPIQKRTSIYVQGCYQYLEAYQYLGLGLLPVFRSTPVFGFRVANISGIKETILVQKHNSIQVQGCQRLRKLLVFRIMRGSGGCRDVYGGCFKKAKSFKRLNFKVSEILCSKCYFH